MKSFNVRHIQHHLAAVLADVEGGEVIEVRRRGRPVARLVGIAQTHEPASWGTASFPAFGIWKDRDDMRDVDTYVRDLRKARTHAD